MDDAVDEPEVVTQIGRWEWDRSKETVQRVLERARVVTWTSAAVISAVLVPTGWLLTDGILHWSSVFYGILAGIAAGYAVRGVYVAAGVRRAIAPVKAAIVPAAVSRASEAQLVSLVVNGGSMFEPFVHVKAAPGEAVVDITRYDYADRTMPRPGFLQLLMTGPDGIYYDDGHGAAGDPGDGSDAGGGGLDLGGDLGGGGGDGGS